MDGLASVDIGADGVRIGALSKQSLSPTKTSLADVPSVSFFIVWNSF